MPVLVIKSKGEEYLCRYDAEDHDLVSRHQWWLSRGYAVTQKDGRTVSMHRMILGIVERPDIEVDHIYHDRLDNRRAMIRTCTRAENSRNGRKRNGYSQYKGIYREGYTWHSQICLNARVFNLGRYRSELTAAKAYDRAAKVLHGDFCNPNFSECEPLPQQMKLPI
jgi:hypothetical protein